MFFYVQLIFRNLFNNQNYLNIDRIKWTTIIYTKWVYVTGMKVKRHTCNILHIFLSNAPVNLTTECRDHNSVFRGRGSCANPDLDLPGGCPRLIFGNFLLKS